MESVVVGEFFKPDAITEVCNSCCRDCYVTSSGEVYASSASTALESVACPVYNYVVFFNEDRVGNVVIQRVCGPCPAYWSIRGVDGSVGLDGDGSTGFD